MRDNVKWDMRKEDYLDDQRIGDERNKLTKMFRAVEKYVDFRNIFGL